jgi:phenylacetate-CoA ligase
MRRMAKITGRSDDMLIIRGVNVFPSQIEEQILRCPGLAPHYRIEVTRPGRLDEISVHVEIKPEIPSGDGRKAADQLRSHIKDVIGISASVVPCAPLSLDRSSGKAARVRDLRGEQSS